MALVPRVAFFTDSYHEANGVARTSTALEAHAAERGWPMLVVHGGRATQVVETGSIARLELRRAKATSFALDHDLRFDVALWRHQKRVAQVLRQFQPDVLHFTGPSDIGMLGAWLGHRFSIPMVGSWHTNLHEYASRRLLKHAGRLRPATQARLGRWVEDRTLELALLFYKIPSVVLAPNTEWQQVLQSRTGHPTATMTRGIDTTVFTPAQRARQDDVMNIGYVGRLSTEKNIKVLPDVERALIAAGINYRFTIVGDGTDSAWLRSQMVRADFTGVLRGEALAKAYANMDVFVFPSETETVGNVVLEAMAAGVPVVAMSHGGHRFITQAGRSALIAEDGAEFIGLTLALACDRLRRETMGANARRAACDRSWSAVFDGVYRSYAQAIEMARPAPALPGDALVGVAGKQPSA